MNNTEWEEWFENKQKKQYRLGTVTALITKKEISSLLSSQLKEVLGVIESKRVTEGRTKEFGDWVAVTYEDKMLVNAVLNDIKAEVSRLK